MYYISIVVFVVLLCIVVLYEFFTKILHLIPFPTINNISISVNRSNFTLVVLFKATCYANSGAERKQAGLSLYT